MMLAIGRRTIHSDPKKSVPMLIPAGKSKEAVKAEVHSGLLRLFLLWITEAVPNIAIR
jgi:alpha-beta hydrolase superfamily lysophospholipase